jgi:hypothetical protein
MSIRLLFCAVLLAFAGTVAAQPAATPKTSSTTATPAAQQLTPEQRQAIMKFRKSMAENATQIARLLDDGHENEVWDNGSELLKKKVTREQFATTIQTARKRSGKTVSRKLVRLSRAHSDGKGTLPTGEYYIVRFVTKFEKNKQPSLETLWYHYDNANTLRVSGYTVRELKPRTSSSAPASGK